MKTDYAESADWAGKLVGNTLRIAGILCRASAIRLGRYYLSHALAVYDAISETAMYKQAEKILKMIREHELTGFNRRDAMRYCQTFKRVDEIQPVLDFLEDFGYIATVDNRPASGKGRPVLPK